MELVPTRARALLPLLCYCILPLNYIYSTLKAYLEDKENENTMKYLKLEAEHRLKTNRIFKKEGFSISPTVGGCGLELKLHEVPTH